MLIHTGCTSVSLLPVIFSGGDAQRSGYSCLPLRPPQMSLGLPFNQCRLYPHMNFGLAAQSWHDNLPTHSVTVVLLSPLGFPIQVRPLTTGMKPHACRLLSGFTLPLMAHKSSDYADGLYRRELSKQTHTCRLIPPRQVPCRFCALLPVVSPTAKDCIKCRPKCVPRSPAASRVHANSISAVSSPQPKRTQAASRLSFRI